MERGMTPEQVAERVAAITAMADDDEEAHVAEDSLWRDVLTAIADGADDASALARAALSTLDIQFAWWCA